MENAEWRGIGASKEGTKKERQELRCVVCRKYGWLAVWLDTVNIAYMNTALFDRR